MILSRPQCNSGTSTHRCYCVRIHCARDRDFRHTRPQPARPPHLSTRRPIRHKTAQSSSGTVIPARSATRGPLRAHPGLADWTATGQDRPIPSPLTVHANLRTSTVQTTLAKARARRCILRRHSRGAGTSLHRNAWVENGRAHCVEASLREGASLSPTSISCLAHSRCHSAGEAGGCSRARCEMRTRAASIILSSVAIVAGSSPTGFVGGCMVAALGAAALPEDVRWSAKGRSHCTLESDVGKLVWRTTCKPTRWAAAVARNVGASAGLAAAVCSSADVSRLSSGAVASRGSRAIDQIFFALGGGAAGAGGAGPVQRPLGFGLALGSGASEKTLP